MTYPNFDLAGARQRLDGRVPGGARGGMAVLYHMVAFTTGGYSPNRNFQFGRSGAIYVRRYARPWQWLTYLAFNAAAFPIAWLREARKKNQAAVVAKIKGIREGLRIEVPPPSALASRTSQGERSPYPTGNV